MVNFWGSWAFVVDDVFGIGLFVAVPRMRIPDGGWGWGWGSGVVVASMVYDDDNDNVFVIWDALGECEGGI